jgi:hypothetical protein
LGGKGVYLVIFDQGIEVLVLVVFDQQIGEDDFLGFLDQGTNGKPM